MLAKNFSCLGSDCDGWLNEAREEARAESSLRGAVLEVPNFLLVVLPLFCLADEVLDNGNRRFNGDALVFLDSLVLFDLASGFGVIRK